MSENGEKLLWNILICICACAGFWMVLSWIKKRTIEIKEDQEKSKRIFANEISILLDEFNHASSRRNLLHLELRIDQFIWYWGDQVSTEQINQAKEKLYVAFYKKLNSLNSVVNS